MSSLAIQKDLEIEVPTLSPDELRKMDAYWRACNYLCAGMLYLCKNPLLREPLKVEHIKNRLLGHWGCGPGTDVYVGAFEPADQEVRPEHDLHFRAGTRCSGDTFEQLTWRACIRRFIPTRARMKRGC